MRFIVDGHQDIAMALLGEAGRNFAQPAGEGQALSLPDAIRGELAVILATVFAPQGYWSGAAPAVAARQQLRLYEELFYRHEESFFRAESQGDLALCQPGGPIGVVHLMEGADPIASPDEIPTWVDDGVRFVGLTWNTPNQYAAGADAKEGVTPAGRALLAAMREHGVVPDLSHLNPRALDDVLAFDDGLVVASHSNAAAVHPHQRNLPDAALKQIAARDGIVGVVLYGPFIGEGHVGMDDLVRHLEHIAEVAGSAHVGIGSDLDGGFTTDMAPDGIDSVADLPCIGQALEARGWKADDVAAVLGGNWMRVLGEALPE